MQNECCTAIDIITKQFFKYLVLIFDIIGLAFCKQSILKEKEDNRRDKNARRKRETVQLT